MSLNNKVLWSEGMFLRPQHFQQQDRNVEFTLLQQARAAGVENWGVDTLAINPEKLLLGKVSIDACKGIFPDGTVFDIPYSDPSPIPINIPEGTSNTIVYLTLPLKRSGVAETSKEAQIQHNARYGAQLADTIDINSEANATAKIQLVAPNLQLSLGGEALDDYTYIGLCKIKEFNPNHKVILDESYIPPCINSKNIKRLSSLIEEVVGLLHQRKEALAHYIASPGRQGASDIEDFLLLQLINKYSNLFNFYLSSKEAKPREFYKSLIQLTGELSTFTTKNRSAIKPPLYQHENLQESFDPIMDELRRALSHVSEHYVVSFQLEEQTDGYFISIIENKSLLNTADFFLAVGAAVPSERIQAHFPALVKISSIEHIETLVNRSLPAIELEVLPAAPRQIPFNAGYTYFKLNKKNKLWKQLDKSSGLALHIAGDFPELEMELWAVKQQS